MKIPAPTNMAIVPITRRKQGFWSTDAVDSGDLGTLGFWLRESRQMLATTSAAANGT